MLLCNAIVGNYDESNFEKIPERLLMERRMIMSGNLDSNTVYILFRIITSDKDISPRENQGLVINYQSVSNTEESGCNDNKKCHYLIPIYNDYNVFCYWTSSRYLKVKKRELRFTISGFIKEYWKQPIFTQEFKCDNDLVGGNNNVICFGDSFKDYQGYNRVIHIEKEENVQIICINLKYKNKDFIIVENLVESIKALSAPSSIFNGNDTIKEFYLSEEQCPEKVSLDELEKNKGGSDSQEEPEKNQDLEYKIEEISSEIDKIPIDSCSKYDNLEQPLDDVVFNDESDLINEEEGCIPVCISAQDIVNETSQSLTVCTEANVSITQQMDSTLEISNSWSTSHMEVEITSNQDVEKSRDKISNFNTGEYQIANSSLTLETFITPAIATPVARHHNLKTGVVDNENVQDMHPKTDLIQRNRSISTNNNISSVDNHFNTCNTRHHATSFLPPGMQIGTTGMGNISQVNKEELILNRIESARKNVNFNCRVHSGGTLMGGSIHGIGRARIPGSRGGISGIPNSYNICPNNYANGVMVNSSNVLNGASHIGIESNYHINLLSKRFNRIIGKTDYLLEQLSNNADINFKFNKNLKDPEDDFGDRLAQRSRAAASSSSLSSCSDPYNMFSNFKGSSLQVGSNNHQMAFDNAFNIKGQIVDQHAKILLSAKDEQDNKVIIPKNFNYTRESNLSIVDNSETMISKNCVDVQVDAQLDMELDDSDKGVKEPVEASDGQYDSADESDDDKVVVGDSGGGELQTVDFDVKLVGSETQEDIEEVEVRRRSIIDPELVEIDFYVNGGRLKSSFSILNIIFSRWSGMPIISKL
ncbi:hypothetical protein OJ252_1262 [Cryptosporidium canis]|uniref:Uncharacterized protein n=1 Tax=Cryptosporidium canis TaxID=195482 RepID=A0ABQ8P8I4_9CRYT|nr:hypothetical protein OJ252_1262 [Cryptosporidium canis]